MPFFSVVIPVYNGAGGIQHCIESLLTQSYNDVEVICVDDGSTDGSREILVQLAERDGRVRVILQPENRGCARARRRGVLESHGEYLLFADQDDCYLAGALSWLKRQLKAAPVDILAYDAEVVGAGVADLGEVRGVQSWVNAPNVCLSGRDVLDACFLRKEYGYSIWNKAYRGEVARCALAASEDVPIPFGEDNYEYFVIAFMADTFKGVPGHYVYQYHYGAGFTGQGKLSLAGWERTASLSIAADLIRLFLEKQGAYESFQETCVVARQHMIDYAFDRFRQEVADEDRSEALRVALRYWTYAEVLQAVALFAPRDLPLLMKVFFGDNGHDDALSDYVERVSSELLDLEGSIKASREAADELRRMYESSRAYKRGRCITKPIRMLKTVRR